MRRWKRCRSHARDLGMSTAEYAIGTVAAAALAGILYKVLTTDAVRTALLGVVQQALRLGE
ncbi:DUF4244 domain-containing protein [Actinomadura rayongensis]|uniref:DUF4244 domain-containing protein n=1 Tax=Actinomadura rayongensis TaxID=1429076 RepID=A0A6I4WFC1_9ACTN|nr:DUF4244 domain-containing protein [Actinomadura rayongensis]MXQ65252.1 DUF4244 domain-containing protein [Actinomadura rayongensis]